MSFVANGLTRAGCEIILRVMRKSKPKFLLTTFFNEQYSQVECIFTDDKCTVHSKNEKVGQVKTR